MPSWLYIHKERTSQGRRDVISLPLCLAFSRAAISTWTEVEGKERQLSSASEPFCMFGEAEGEHYGCTAPMPEIWR